MAWLTKNVLLMHFNDMLYNILLKIARASNHHLININEAFTNRTLIYSVGAHVLPWSSMHVGHSGLTEATIVTPCHPTTISDFKIIIIVLIINNKTKQNKKQVYSSLSLCRLTPFLLKVLMNTN